MCDTTRWKDVCNIIKCKNMSECDIIKIICTIYKADNYDRVWFSHFFSSSLSLVGVSAVFDKASIKSIFKLSATKT